MSNLESPVPPTFQLRSVRYGNNGLETVEDHAYSFINQMAFCPDTLFARDLVVPQQIRLLVSVSYLIKVTCPDQIPSGRKCIVNGNVCINEIDGSNKVVSIHVPVRNMTGVGAAGVVPKDVQLAV